MSNYSIPSEGVAPAIVKLFQKTKSISSTTDKTSLIESFLRSNRDELTLELLRYYFDTDITFGFSALQYKKTGYDFTNILSQNSEVIDDDKVYTMGDTNVLALLKTLRNRFITGNEALDDVKAVLDNVPYYSKILLWLILTRETVGFDIKILNKAYKKVYNEEFITKFQCQLADKYIPGKNYNTDYWYSSPKLDGVRCVFMDGKLQSRQRKDIHGFDEIAETCKELASKYNLQIIDGELYSHTVPFQTIQSYVMSSKNIDVEKKNQIFLFVFAVLGDDITNTKNMVEKLDKISDNLGHIDNVRIVPYSVINNDSQTIETIARKHVEDGYEGVMLRHPDVHYAFKRSKDLLKFKLFEEDDFIIVGFETGNGKYSNTLGNIIVESADKKIRSEVGTGFSDEQRNYIYTHQDEFLGKITEIKYQGITDDGTSLRFPVWVNKLKEDR